MRQRSYNPRAATNALEHDADIAKVTGATHRRSRVMSSDLSHPPAGRTNAASGLGVVSPKAELALASAA
jgi:hypothetical protein